MPFITYENISSWYFFQYLDSGIPMIFENWSETQTQPVEQVSLVQGDIGTRVMNIGGMKWETKIASPVLITDLPSYQALDVVIACVENPNKFIYVDLPNLRGVLKSAKISIAESGVTCNATLWADGVGIMPPFLNNTVVAPINFGRVAKWFDTSVNLLTTNPDPALQQLSAFVIGGDINIEVDVSENFFMGQSPIPNFSIQGYRISGELTIMVPPYVPIAFYSQGANALTIDGSLLEFWCAGRVLFNSDIVNMPVIWSDVERAVKGKELTQAKISFKSYAKINNTNNN